MCIYTKSINDQTFVIRQIMEKCYEYNTDLHILLNEIWQAFDNKDRYLLFQLQNFMAYQKNNKSNKDNTK